MALAGLWVLPEGPGQMASSHLHLGGGGKRVGQKGGNGGPEERWETSSWGVEGAGRSLQVARVGVPGGVVCLGYGGPGTGPGLGRTGRHHCVGCCLP